MSPYVFLCNYNESYIKNCATKIFYFSIYTIV